MQAEPPNAEPPKRKRRWFQFSLRTLLIVVTLLAVALAGWRCVREAGTARERMALLVALQAHGGEYQLFLDGAGPPMTLVRRWAGDRPIIVIWLPKPPDGLDVEQVRRAFPESQFLNVDSGSNVATSR
jgi:hypothetical protein